MWLATRSRLTGSFLSLSTMVLYVLSDLLGKIWVSVRQNLELSFLFLSSSLQIVSALAFLILLLVVFLKCWAGCNEIRSPARAVTDWVYCTEVAASPRPAVLPAVLRAVRPLDLFN